MSSSTTLLDLIAQSQSSKEVTANALFDAGSPATLYGRRASLCSGLTWAYYGGNVTLSSGSIAAIANGTLTLSASATNYVVASMSSGAVSSSTSNTNWNDTANYFRLYSVVTGASTVTSYTDVREIGKMTGGGSTASGWPIGPPRAFITSASSAACMHPWRQRSPRSMRPALRRAQPIAS